MRDVTRMVEGVLGDEIDLNLGRFMKADFRTLLQIFESYINSHSRKKLRVAIFYFKNADFPESGEYDDFSLDGDRFEDVLKIDLKRRIQRSDLDEGYRVVEGIFFVKNLGDEHHIALTLEGRDFFTLGLRRLLEYLSPDYTKPVLTSEEILRLLSSYCEGEQAHYRIVPRKTVFYNRKEESEINHTSDSLDQIVDRYTNEDLYVNKIWFNLLSGEEGANAFSGSVGRDGSVEFKDGSISLLMDMVDKIFEPADHKSSVFGSSDRNDFKRLTKKSIKIEYGKPVLSGTKDNEQLFRTLGNIARSDYLVFHHNPYLHVLFFDYIDGSKFDIFGLDDRTISIVPYVNSTESSFNKMLEGLQREFGGGAVGENVFQDYSLKDIMA